MIPVAAIAVSRGPAASAIPFGTTRNVRIAVVMLALELFAIAGALVVTLLR